MQMITGFSIHVLTITSGILFMSALLNVQIKQVKTLRQWCGVFVIMLIYITCAVAFPRYGDVAYRTLYPLLVHLPILIAFCLLCRYSLKKILFAFVTTLVMVSTPLMITLCISQLGPLPALERLLILAVTSLFLLFALRRWIAPSVHFVFAYQDKMWWLYLCIPMVYCIGTYMSKQYIIFIEYTWPFKMLSATLWLVVQFSYVLIFSLFHHMKSLYEQDKSLRVFIMRQETAQHPAEGLRAAQEQSAIYRHDMRYHLSLIGGFANEGNIQKIKEYLSSTEADIDAATPVCYCQNQTVNLIMSTFNARAKKEGVVLLVDIVLPYELGINDTELCSLFSNALENAIYAAAQVADQKSRRVYVRSVVNNNKLVVSIENAYIGTVEMKGGVPKPTSKKAGHGFGIKSMIATVERHEGLYSFETTGGMFVLHIMLPLKNEPSLGKNISSA